MLNGLTALELGRLRISVGYGGQKKGRPLSPIEVGMFIRQELDTGKSLDDCAKEIQLNGTTHIGRFLRILELPSDLQHLIDWGVSKNSISFSSAFELTRLNDADDQRFVADAILRNKLTSKEVRQVIQIINRSQTGIFESVEQVLKMRPIIEKRYLYMGSIVDPAVESKLAIISQKKRNNILKSSIDRLGLQGVSGRLGPKIFTLVGDWQFHHPIKDIGKGDLESHIRVHVKEALRDNV